MKLEEIEKSIEKRDPDNTGLFPKVMFYAGHERELIDKLHRLKDAIEKSLVIFIAVGTPPDEDGSADLKHVLGVASDIGKYLEDYLVVVTKSTVPVGTAKKVNPLCAAAGSVRSSVMWIPPHSLDSAMPLMYIFSPLRTHASPWRAALQRVAPRMSEPPPGSVVAMPKKPCPWQAGGRIIAFNSEWA